LQTRPEAHVSAALIVFADVVSFVAPESIHASLYP
jgi:hypothetical protein